ncbi:MAG TPA: cytochrome c, partial [Saprospiraceae bacterium]|nr:cytochrome c [Saprospiraceae bacterium]
MNKQLIISSLLSLVFVLTAFVVSAEVSVDAGKQLFKANCAQCHNRNMKDNLTGPALGGVQERWAGREELLYGWIRNSQSVIASGDPYAVDLYNTWNKVL